MKFLYTIESAQGLGRVYVRDGLYLNKAQPDGYGGRPEWGSALKQFEQAFGSYQVVFHYNETIEAETDGGIDQVYAREEPYPLSIDDAVFDQGKLVGFFLYFPHHFRMKDNAHLFLSDDPSTHKRVIDSSTYYELRKK